MIRAALLSLYRAVQRHPFHAALNTLGLSFGIAVFIVLSLFVRFETGYERWLPHAGQIYEATTQVRGAVQKDRPPTVGSAGLFLDSVRKTFPDVVGTRIANSYMNIRVGNHVYEEVGQFVDPDFFKVFDISLLEGDKVSALRDPDGVLISEPMALKYFGTVKAVGRYLDISDDGYQDIPAPLGAHSWRVTGVIRSLPKNSNLQLDFVRLLRQPYISTTPYWNTWSVATRRNFLLLPSRHWADTINARLDDIIRTNGEILRTREKGILSVADVHVRVMPLVEEHLMAPQDRAGVIAMSTAATIALSAALINYINLTTARAGPHAREVAMRKSVGATTKRLRVQFLAEGLIAVIFAFILGLSIAELALPAINRLGKLSLSLDYAADFGWLLGLFAVVLMSGGLASIYPALVLSEVPAAAALATFRFARSPQQATVRERLVFFQFFTVASLFVVLIGLAGQLRHMETSDIGVARNNILITDSTISQYVSLDEVRIIQEKWRKLPGVISIGAGNVPGPTHLAGKVMITSPTPPARNLIFQFDSIAGDFFQTCGTPLITGRFVSEADNTSLDPRHPAQLTRTVNVDINEAAVESLGLVSPVDAVGKDMAYQQGRLHIVGVVANQRLDTPEVKVWPTTYTYRSAFNQYTSTLISFHGATETQMRQRLGRVWHDIKPDLPITFTSMKEALDVYYAGERRNTRLMAVGSLAAGLIGAIGLFGMAAFSASTRTVEIGIRKSLGASRWQVTRLLLIQFLKPVVIGNLLSWPVSYGILHVWLEQFDDRATISPWFFAAGLGISVTIAIVTVGAIALKAASAAPGRALRRL